MQRFKIILGTGEDKRTVHFQPLGSSIFDKTCESLLINGLVTNIRYFDTSNTPFYVTKRLESLLIEIANFNYFDPLYHYIEQEYGIEVSLAKYRKGQGSYGRSKYLPDTEKGVRRTLK